MQPMDRVHVSYPGRAAAESRALQPAVIQALHSQTTHTQSLESFIPEHIQWPCQGSLKSAELLLITFHVHGDSAQTRVGGRPAEHAGCAPRSAPYPAPNTQPRKNRLWWPSQTTACFDRNQFKKIEGKIPFCEYSKCHRKLSMKQKLTFSPLQTPALFQFPTAKSLFLLPAVKVGKVK